MPISGGINEDEYRQSGPFVEYWDGNRWVRQLTPQEERMLILMADMIDARLKANK